MPKNQDVLLLHQAAGAEVNPPVVMAVGKTAMAKARELLVVVNVALGASNNTPMQFADEIIVTDTTPAVGAHAVPAQGYYLPE